MRWYQSLYLSDSIKEKCQYYKYITAFTKKRTGLFYIIRAYEKKALFDIVSSDYLRNPYMKNRDYLILGMAATHEEAIELAGEMVLDMLKQSGQIDVDAFLEKKIKTE